MKPKKIQGVVFFESARQNNALVEDWWGYTQCRRRHLDRLCLPFESFHYQTKIMTNQWQPISLPKYPYQLMSITESVCFNVQNDLATLYYLCVGLETRINIFYMLLPDTRVLTFYFFPLLQAIQQALSTSFSSTQSSWYHVHCKGMKCSLVINFLVLIWEIIKEQNK